MNCSFAPNSTSCSCLLDTPEQELRLSAFIRFTLQQACINKYSSDAVMQLLDRAWEAQKLLWKLRIQRSLSDD